MADKILYIKGEQIVEVSKPDVTLNDLFEMECVDKQILSHLKTMKVLKFTKKEYRRSVISILKIIEDIHQLYPNLTVENLGDVDIIVAYEKQKTPSKAFHISKVIVVCVISFLGSAYSIMAFSNDVDTLEIFDQLYLLFTGTEKTGFTVLEASYCIGLVVGILVFFNHFGKYKFTTDPTPMEVEMRLYEKDIQTTLIENFARKQAEIDVDKTAYINPSRK